MTSLKRKKYHASINCVNADLIKKRTTCSGMLKTRLNNVLLPTLFHDQQC